MLSQAASRLGFKVMTFGPDKNNGLDEVFLTLAPVLAGRESEERLGMIAGVELLPDHGAWMRMLSARRHGNFLFLRYGLKKS